jgi:hypothetical protein
MKLLPIIAFSHTSMKVRVEATITIVVPWKKITLTLLFLGIPFLFIAPGKTFS